MVGAVLSDRAWCLAARSPRAQPHGRPWDAARSLPEASAGPRPAPSLKPEAHRPLCTHQLAHTSVRVRTADLRRGRLRAQDRRKLAWRGSVNSMGDARSQSRLPCGSDSQVDLWGTYT